MILVGDIGGTKTNLAYAEASPGSITLSSAFSYASRDYASLLEIVRDYRHTHPASVNSAAFGIAGPVIGNRCTATNLPWVVEGKELADALGGIPVRLLNDLEATAYGILRVADRELVVLNRGTPEPHGTVAVIAPGTGLGEGALLWTGGAYRALPTEGGHTDFAPRNELEIDFLRYMLRIHKRVSYERILSGPGLVAMYDFFRQRSGVPAPEQLAKELTGDHAAAAVSAAAMSGRDAVCGEALSLFVSLLGAETGNLALKFLSRGGVYLAGGIPPKIRPAIEGGDFIASFVAKGRFSPLLQQIPVHLVLNESTALLGAAHAAP